MVDSIYDLFFFFNLASCSFIFLPWITKRPRPASVTTMFRRKWGNEIPYGYSLRRQCIFLETNPYQTGGFHVLKVGAGTHLIPFGHCGKQIWKNKLYIYILSWVLLFVYGCWGGLTMHGTGSVWISNLQSWKVLHFTNSPIIRRKLNRRCGMFRCFSDAGSRKSSHIDIGEPSPVLRNPLFRNTP